MKAGSLTSNPQSGGPGLYNDVSQLNLQVLGSFSITFYNSQGYGRDVLTHLHIGSQLYHLSIFSQSSASFLYKIFHPDIFDHIGLKSLGQ
jgi:hypothetical protein